MGRSLLELGGNNAIIVDASADLKLAIPAIAFGAVGTAGQRCTTTRRLIVHESIYDDVLAKLITAYKQVEKKIGDPTDPTNLMGPLNSRDAVQAYLDAIAKAKASRRQGRDRRRRDRGQGQLRAADDRHRPDQRRRVVQTRDLRADPVRHEVRDARRGHRDAERRAAGPVVVDLHPDLKAAEAFLSASGSDCGIANVNIGTSGAEIGGAFGGEKETGGGRESGSDAWAPTCAARRTRSTTPMRCRWRRASSSTCEVGTVTKAGPPRRSKPGGPAKAGPLREHGMRIAVVSDIHGNLGALHAVLADIGARACDVTVNLGDILSGPLQRVETADCDRPGPADDPRQPRTPTAGAARGHGRVRRPGHDLLRPDQLDWIAALPATLA